MTTVFIRRGRYGGWGVRDMGRGLTAWRTAGGGQQQAKKRDLREDLVCELPASRTARKEISVALAARSAILCYSRPSKLIRYSVEDRTVFSIFCLENWIPTYKSMRLKFYLMPYIYIYKLTPNGSRAQTLELLEENIRESLKTLALPRMSRIWQLRLHHN